MVDRAQARRSRRAVQRAVADNSGGEGQGQDRVTELDVWRSAGRLMKRYGAEAIIIAAKRVAALLDVGDLEGCAAWVRIAR
jgi:hypothetical protein